MEVHLCVSVPDSLWQCHCSRRLAARCWCFRISSLYFNGLSGGPLNGWKRFADSNVDWGQGLADLDRILDKRSESRACRDRVHRRASYARGDWQSRSVDRLGVATVAA